MLKKDFKRQDNLFKKILALIYNPGVQSLILYRISHFCVNYQLMKWFGVIVWRFNLFLTGADIHPKAILGNGVVIYHTVGVVIGETAIIHNDVKIMHGITLGSINIDLKTKRHPTIMDNVLLGANCSVLGNIIIGKNSKIGANATVVDDIPKDSIVVNQKAIIL